MVILITVLYTIFVTLLLVMLKWGLWSEESLKQDSYSRLWQSTQPLCSCKDWTRYQIPCKHFFTVFRYIPLWQWDSLPTSYLQSEYLSQDIIALASMQETDTHPHTCDDPLEGQSTCDDHPMTLDEFPKQQVHIYKQTSIHECTPSENVRDFCFRSRQWRITLRGCPLRYCGTNSL